MRSRTSWRSSSSTSSCARRSSSFATFSLVDRCAGALVNGSPAGDIVCSSTVCSLFPWARAGGARTPAGPIYAYSERDIGEFLFIVLGSLSLIGPACRSHALPVY
jgi:hypothetical protein